MLRAAKWLFISSLISLAALQSSIASSNSNQQRSFLPDHQRQQQQPEDDVQGRNLLDWIGLGTGPDTDPYLARTNEACLNGDLAECFKSRALGSLDDFFDKPAYQLTEHARIVRMPKVQLRQLLQEPFEYSEAPRADEPEWDQLVKFAMRKGGRLAEHRRESRLTNLAMNPNRTALTEHAHNSMHNFNFYNVSIVGRQITYGRRLFQEMLNIMKYKEIVSKEQDIKTLVEKFLKASAIEVEFDNEVTEHGRYSPRFIDEIADEIDVIEDKKDSLFNRKQLKKLFIPMLIILKLFKLKLLLFLPLILGLASFKKLLGFLAIVIPGLIGFFKLCKPHLQSGNYYTGPHYSPAGIGYQQPHHFRDPSPSFASHDYPEHHHGGATGGVHFGGGGGDDSYAQNLAYNGWGHYRNNGAGGDIKAEGSGGYHDSEVSTKKSILPDS